MNFNWTQHNGRGQKSFDQIYREALSNPKRLIIIIVLIILSVLILSAFFTSVYKLEAQEAAVVTRFGKHIKTASPGLNFKLPFGIDSAYIVKTTELKQETFGYRSEGDTHRGRQLAVSLIPEEALMFTGDLNIATVMWVVYYRISDPKSYLFKVREPSKNIRDVSQAVMRRVIGDRIFSDVRTGGGAAIQEEATRLMQEILDHYKLGVTIERVQLQRADPPEPVRPAFDDVNVAKQEQEQAINRAKAQQNKVIPEARGKAQEQISIAQGYAISLTNRAEGDANRFLSVLDQYSAAPDITRKRIYLETIEELLSKFQSLTIIDPSITGVLPVFGAKGGRISPFVKKNLLNETE